MKRFWTALLAVMLLLTPMRLPGAHAEDVFRLTDADFIAPNVEDAAYRAEHLTSAASYVNLSFAMPEEAAVSLLITREDTGETVYARDYGILSGAFHSEDIYLRLDGSALTYRVQLTWGDAVYTFPIDRVMPLLRGNAACSAGYPLSAISGADTWQTVTLLDVAALEGSSVSYDLCASNSYLLGTVDFSISGGAVSASVSLLDGVNASIDSATVYVASTALEASTLGRRGCTAPSGSLDSYIPCSSGLAAVYVKLKVSYAAEGLPASSASTLPGQAELWERMQQETPAEAVG